MRTRTENVRAMRLIRQTWIMAAGILAGLTSVGYVAFGATYNFYFNNTEQGDNSTATPAVTVHGDGKVEKSAGLPELQTPPAPVQSPGPKLAVEDFSSRPSAPLPIPAPAEGKTEARTSMWGQWWDDLPLGSTELRHFRVTAGATALLNGDHIGPSFNAAIVFNKYVAINGYAAYFAPSRWREHEHGIYGGELELTPLHIPVGATHPRFIELGLVAGVSNLFPLPENYVSPHGGGRLTLNFGKTLALSGVFRGNAGYQMVEGGLSVKL